MKTKLLTISTVRLLTDDEWEDYKIALSQAGITADFETIEREGTWTLNQVSRDDEVVETVFKLEPIRR